MLMTAFSSADHKEVVPVFYHDNRAYRINFKPSDISKDSVLLNLGKHKGGTLWQVDGIISPSFQALNTCENSRNDMVLLRCLNAEYDDKLITINTLIIESIWVLEQ